MNRFVDALISEEKNSLIPDEYDYWKDVIGSWNLDFVLKLPTPFGAMNLEKSIL